MDLNELFYRQQVSLMRAAAASCPEARHAHQGLAKGYGGRIHLAQVQLGVLFKKDVAAGDRHRLTAHSDVGLVARPRQA